MPASPQWMMKRAAATLVVLICACGATTAQAATKRRSPAACHKHAIGHRVASRCSHHSNRPTRALEVRELVWEAPIKGNQPAPDVVLAVVTEGRGAANEPVSPEARKEAQEEAQEAKEEAAEAAKERAEELG